MGASEPAQPNAQATAKPSTPPAASSPSSAPIPIKSPPKTLNVPEKDTKCAQYTFIFTLLSSKDLMALCVSRASLSVSPPSSTFLSASPGKGPLSSSPSPVAPLSLHMWENQIISNTMKITLAPVCPHVAMIPSFPQPFLLSSSSSSSLFFFPLLQLIVAIARPSRVASSSWTSLPRS